MDWSDQPAVPAHPSQPSPFPSTAAYTPPPGTGSVAPVETDGRSILSGTRRTVASVVLAVGLLTVGGAAVVFAADPSATPAPSATTQPSTGGTTRPSGQAPKSHSGADCPNMGGSSGSSGSGGSGTTPAPSDGSTSSPSTSDL